MTRTVGLIAATLTGNHGAEAMASTVIGRLRDRHPDLNFILFSYYPGADRRVLTADHVEIASSTPLRLLLAHFPGALLAACLPKRWRTRSAILPNEIRKMSACAMLIDLAGVSFIEGREKFLPFNILTLLPAMLLGVPVVKAAQALGPFKGFVNRTAARAILPRCALIAARGEGTSAHLQSLGLQNYMDAPDIAFLMEESDRLVAPDLDYLDTITSRIEQGRAAGGKVIGIVPSSVIYAKAGQAYIDALAELAARLQEAGNRIVLIPNATRMADGQRLRNNDIPVVRLLGKRLSAGGGSADPVLVDRDIDAVSIKQVIAACDVMIISRFHAMIAALSLCKPTVVFGWSHKYAEVMNAFGLGEWVFDYTRMDVREIAPRVTELIGSRQRIADEIADVLPQIRARATKQVDAIDALLGPASKEA